MMLKPKHLILHWMQSQNTLINNIKGIYYFYSKWNKEKPQKKQRHFYVKMRTIYPTEWKQAWHAALRVLNMNVMVIWGHLPPPPAPFFSYSIKCLVLPTPSCGSTVPIALRFQGLLYTGNARQVTTLIILLFSFWIHLEKGQSRLFYLGEQLISMCMWHTLCVIYMNSSRSP